MTVRRFMSISQAIGYYQCTKDRNKYDACPDLTGIKADKVNDLVWQDCCRVFEAIEQIRHTIRSRLEHDVQAFIDSRHGRASFRLLVSCRFTSP